jgi:hypothetical protein
LAILAMIQSSPGMSSFRGPHSAAANAAGNLGTVRHSGASNDHNKMTATI